MAQVLDGFAELANAALIFLERSDSLLLSIPAHSSGVDFTHSEVLGTYTAAAMLS